MKLIKVIQTYGRKKKEEWKLLLLGVQSALQECVAAKQALVRPAEERKPGRGSAPVAHGSHAAANGLSNPSKTGQSSGEETVQHQEAEPPVRRLPTAEEAEKQLQEMMAQLPDMDTAANDNRRFTMMVEEILAPRDGYGVAVAGKVHGMVHKGDTVYLMDAAERKTLCAKVALVEMRVEGKLIPVNYVEDAIAGIRLADVMDRKQVEIFSILTSIRPQPIINVAKACENPLVLGLSYEYYRFREHTGYKERLFRSILQGHYVLPVKTEADFGGQILEAVIQQDRFYRLPHPSGSGRSILPVFTDWEAMRAWDIVQSSKGPLRTVTLDFFELAMLVTDGRDDDLAINLFQSSPLILTADTICDLLSAERLQGKQAAPTWRKKGN